MRVLQQELKEHDDRRVRLAIEIFCYRARKYIGAYLACMGGADAVVFTGGIGENSADIRVAFPLGLAKSRSLGSLGMTNLGSGLLVVEPR